MRCNCIRPSVRPPQLENERWTVKEILACRKQQQHHRLALKSKGRSVCPSVRPSVRTSGCRVPTERPTDRPTAIDPISARNRNSPPPLRVTRWMDAPFNNARSTEATHSTISTCGAVNSKTTTATLLSVAEENGGDFTTENAIWRITGFSLSKLHSSDVCILFVPIPYALKGERARAVMPALIIARPNLEWVPFQPHSLALDTNNGTEQS